jgi:putative addiction module component (TIGR02574 family)
MTTRSRELLEAALRLSAKERAELAVELVASVDGEADSDAQAAWAAEIVRRVRRTRDGTARTTDWPTLRKRIRRRLES